MKDLIRDPMKQLELIKAEQAKKQQNVQWHEEACRTGIVVDPTLARINAIDAILEDELWFH